MLSYGERNSKCFKADAALLVNHITKILNDLVAYILPMLRLWGIQIPKKQTIGLAALFSVATLNVSLNNQDQPSHFSVYSFARRRSTRLSLTFSNHLLKAQVQRFRHCEPLPIRRQERLLTLGQEAVEVDLGIVSALVPALNPYCCAGSPNSCIQSLVTPPPILPEKDFLQAGNCTFYPKARDSTTTQIFQILTKFNALSTTAVSIPFPSSPK